MKEVYTKAATIPLTMSVYDVLPRVLYEIQKCLNRVTNTPNIIKWSGEVNGNDYVLRGEIEIEKEQVSEKYKQLLKDNPDFKALIMKKGL